MREILFRGKKYGTDEWCYGSLQCFKGYSIFDTIWKHFIHVDYKTVGQYVGLKDRKQHRIFEGDIIRFHKFRDEPDWVGLVEYDESCALYIVKGKRPVLYAANDPGYFEVQLSSIDKDTIEIIGNRWDNIDILESLL